MNVPPVSKLKLEDRGTRYDHLQDLLGLWEAGLEIRQRSYTSFPTSTDRKQLEKLEGAIFLLKTFMDQISRYDEQRWRLRDDVDRAHEEAKRLLTEGTK